MSKGVFRMEIKGKEEENKKKNSYKDREPLFPYRI
jgi:hypothetical protein